VPLKVFDFFSGCGGTSAGLKEAGMDIVMGLDIDSDSAATFQHNFPEAKFIQKDIRLIDMDVLNPLMNECLGNPVLFSGCAPCQPFSIQNRSRKSSPDKRTDLLIWFGKFVERFNPDYVLVENVPGIQAMLINAPGPLQEFISLLKNLGYAWDVCVIQSQDYGVPQRRARLVLIASRHGEIQLPAKTHGPEAGIPYITAWEAIQHLPPIVAGEKHETIPNHVSASLSKLNMRRIEATPEGGDRRDWDEELMLKCHKKTDASDKRFRGHMDVYGRVRKHQPATGLTTRCISLSNGRFGHPDQHRALSVREAACLQTFPETFVFHGSMNSTAKQVGNAVPVLLAQKLGEQIIQHSNAQPIAVAHENRG
jgi:DNA (cytosine-5)-methyltransferase 1